jgi:hypothetical protein
MQESRSGEDWSEDEVRLIVADYFVMLDRELAGLSVNKSEHSRDLIPRLGRSKGSIEFKHRNISAVLDLLGLEWADGYKPAHNYQQLLAGIIEETILSRTNIVEDGVPISFSEPSSLFEEPPPQRTKHAQSRPDFIQRLIRKFDPVERDFRNRQLGAAGEEMIYEREKSTLITSGRLDLARKVRWTSREDGDGAGFDIWSFDASGREKFIEVKTTNGSSQTPFFMTSNEKSFAEEAGESYRLQRLYNFRRGPRLFELAPPLAEHVSFSASVFRATFNEA